MGVQAGMHEVVVTDVALEKARRALKKKRKKCLIKSVSPRPVICVFPEIDRYISRGLYRGIEV